MISALSQSITFKILVNDGQGTGFAIKHNKKGYLVTAKHVVKGVPDKGEVQFFICSKYGEKQYTGKVHLSKDPEADVAVIETEFANEIELKNLKCSSEGLVLSQEVYFLGFPYGIDGQGQGLNKGYKLPIVKHGIVASLFEDDSMICLDAINNAGFSGGPVVCKRFVDGELEKIESIIGVVSGYRQIETEVYDKNGKKLDEYIYYNTGLMIAEPIEKVISIVEEIS